MAKLKLEIRRVSPTEYRNELIDLFNEVFSGNQISEEQFIWKYENNPLGKMLVWAAWDVNSNKIVAAFSAFKRNVIYKNKIITVYQGADGMVTQMCRGHGIFTKLTTEMMDHVATTGSPLWFGNSTNDASGPIMAKFENARELYNSHVYVFINGFRNIASTILKRREKLAKVSGAILSPPFKLLNWLKGYQRPNDIRLVPIGQFNEQPETWSFLIAKSNTFFPLRDEPFLNWKVLNAPKSIKKDLYPFWLNQNDRHIGYCILYHEKRKNKLKIIDLLCENSGQYLVKCIQSIRHFAIQKQADAITTNVTSTDFSQALLAAGFRRGTSIRCTLFHFHPDFLKQKNFGNEFLFQMPIDKDNFDY